MTAKFEITMKETGERLTLPINAEKLEELKDGWDTVESDEFEVETYDGAWYYMPIKADLDSLNEIAAEIQTIQVRGEEKLLIAVMEAYKDGRGGLKLKTNISNRYYPVQAAILDIYNGRFELNDDGTIYDRQAEKV